MFFVRVVASLILLATSRPFYWFGTLKSFLLLVCIGAYLPSLVLSLPRAGVGKTTLLTRLGNGDIRGFPTHLKCLYVKHEILSELGESVVGFMREVTKEDGVCECVRKEAGIREGGGEGVVCDGV